MLNPEEKICYEYMIDQALTGELPPSMTYRPSREELEKVPEEQKKFMINLIMGYQKNNPIMKKILKDYENKYPDAAFGMRIKGYIKELI